MLDKPSAQFALAAAARVSCAAVLAATACKRTAPSDEPETSEPGSTQSVIAEPDPYLDDADRQANLGRDPITPERAAIEACQQQLAPLASDQSRKVSESDKACCERLSEHAWAPKTSEDPDADAQAERDAEFWWQIQSPCCAALDWSTAACTPWGPPTPPERLATVPEARGLLDLRARARAEALTLAAPTSDALRTAAVATWRARMVNEHGSARVFEGLAAQLDALAQREAIPATELARARRFADEERLHGILCGAVVEALGGEAAAEALPAPPYPRHLDAGDELEATLRNLLSVCCLSETVAVALIAAERHEMPEGPLRELLTRIWADECGHANFGWRLLPTLLARANADSIAALGDYLALAFAHLEAHELAHLPERFVAPEGGEAYGLCTGAEARALFFATVEQVIIPGLEARGLPARAAWDQRAAA